MTDTKEIDFLSLIPRSFHSVHRDIRERAHTHYALCGGRGSCKSSFVSLEIIRGIMSDRSTNAIAVRKTGNNLRGSVFGQLLWAIDMLGVSGFWDSRVSIPELIYKPTGQRIMFRGADDPRKFKSIRCPRGYIRYIWFEETDEFDGTE